MWTNHAKNKGFNYLKPWKDVQIVKPLLKKPQDAIKLNALNAHTYFVGIVIVNGVNNIWIVKGLFVSNLWMLFGESDKDLKPVVIQMNKSIKIVKSLCNNFDMLKKWEKIWFFKLDDKYSILLYFFDSFI